MAAIGKNAGDGESKKRKLSEAIAYGDSKFKGFKLCKVLSDNARHKCMFLHGQIADNDAVVLLEKLPIDADDVAEIISNKSNFEETLSNDIYSTNRIYPDPCVNALKATLIHPATAKHIAKYTDQETYIILETSNLYREVTLPYLQSQKFSLQWVYNILDHTCESERIVFEDSSPDTGFILLPDMKWNGVDISSLYLVAITHCKDIKSLRDLTQHHLPLLNNILQKGYKSIKDKYSIDRSKLRVYVHYQPSYYHFHVHFTHVKLEAPGFEADRAHLLEDVISNIEMNAEYYQNKSILFKVKENDGLYNAYKDTGYFKDNE